MSNRIDLFHVEVPMTEPFRISSGEVSTKESIVVRLEREGVVGYGEASPMAGGFYSAETPATTLDYMVREAIPAVLEDGTFHPPFAARYVNEREADPFAWAGLEGALWDLEVQERGLSFLDMLGAECKPVESGLAVGIYPDLDGLLEACSRYMTAGYKRLKIKIEPGWDVAPLRAIRDRFGDIPLMVDANAAYAEEHFPVFDEVDDLGLVMIEQPLAKSDLGGHARLQERIDTPICLDESATDADALTRAFDIGACRIVNLKIQRVGGILLSKKLCDLCAAEGIPTWMGTMPELGIGALHALYLAMLPNCAFPTDVEASRRWFVEDIIDPPIEVFEGLIDLPPAHRQRPNVDMNVVDRYTKTAKRFAF